MLWRIDTGSPEPIHEQISAQGRRAIASGDLSPGDRLAPARTIAEELDVNVHTVLRGLQTLRDEGLIEMRRGRGTLVTDRAAELAQPVSLAQTFVAEVRRLGLSRSEIINLVEAQL